MLRMNKKKLNWIYNTGNKKERKTYDFQKFKTIRSFGSEISNIIRLTDASEEQAIYFNTMYESKNKRSY